MFRDIDTKRFNHDDDLVSGKRNVFREEKQVTQQEACQFRVLPFIVHCYLTFFVNAMGISHPL